MALFEKVILDSAFGRAVIYTGKIIGNKEIELKSNFGNLEIYIYSNAEYFIEQKNSFGNIENNLGTASSNYDNSTDKIKINVDVKFPYQNLQKMAETNDKATKNELEKIFERDVREKIKQVTSREYINPEGDTVDFVVMFIPNEMIFSYIYEKMNDLWVEAMKQKVVLAGPFSFTAILRLVRQAYDNFKYQKNVQKIIGYIKNFEVEFDKYNEEFLKIGERIESLSKQYNVVNSTRTNQLTRSIDKIKIEDSSSNNLLT